MLTGIECLGSCGYLRQAEKIVKEKRESADTLSKQGTSTLSEQGTSKELTQVEIFNLLYDQLPLTGSGVIRIMQIIGEGWDYE